MAYKDPDLANPCLRERSRSALPGKVEIFYPDCPENLHFVIAGNLGFAARRSSPMIELHTKPNITYLFSSSCDCSGHAPRTPPYRLQNCTPTSLVNRQHALQSEFSLFWPFPLKVGNVSHSGLLLSRMQLFHRPKCQKAKIPRSREPRFQPGEVSGGVDLLWTRSPS